jgi:hypothetical protein
LAKHGRPNAAFSRIGVVFTHIDALPQVANIGDYLALLPRKAKSMKLQAR